MQTAPEQICPLSQGTAEPHAHAPVSQLSARFESHGLQAAPPVPQVESDGLLQLLLESQQPPGQLWTSQPHEPFTQCWPASHSTPLVPHSQVPSAAQLSARSASQT